MKQAFLKEPKHIKAWLIAMHIKVYTIHPDGVVDVPGDVDLKGRLGSLTQLPIQFGKVGGNFDCQYSHLTTLEGSPQEVGGGFICSDNKLTTLKGSPQKVGKGFWCEHNHLTTLEGGPVVVAGGFDCRNNRLVDLEGSPQKVDGNFLCADNHLTTLEGSPKDVGGGFWCFNNQLTTLEGSPQKVGETFVCHGNNLVDFVGLENTKVGKDIRPIWHSGYLALPEGKADNTIVSLKGLREEYYGKVQGLDVEAIKAREQDTSLDIMV